MEFSASPEEIRAVEKEIKTGTDQSFFVMDVRDIREKVSLWKRCFPRVEPFFAVKVNDHPDVLRTIVEEGLGFDCASQSELERILALGLDTDKIIYAHTVKVPSHIEYAKKYGVAKMTFDNEAELYKIKEIYPEAQLVLRIKVDDENALYKLGQKFGCPTGDTQTLLETAKKLNLEVIGTSFHVGCSNSNPVEAFTKALRDSRVVCDQGTALGFQMKFIDIGGGWPGDKGCYKHMLKVSVPINETMDKLFPPCENYRIISEPGTFFVGSACTIYSPIIGKKILKSQEDNTNIRHYFVNESVYKSFILSLFGDEVVVIEGLNQRPGNKLHRSVVWGNTCDGYDKIRGCIDLPEMAVGDWIRFPSMGHYTITLHTPFNGFPDPKIIVIGTDDSKRHVATNGSA